MRFRRLSALLVFVASAFGLSATAGSNERPLVVKPGDLIVKKEDDGWKAIRILAVDSWPDGSSAAHCLTYRPLADRPTRQTLSRAEVFVWHAPIDAGSFGVGWELIDNSTPSPDQLAGFVEYLKRTDFPRYIAFTGKDSNEIVRRANEHYQRGNLLGERNQRLEAIDEYSKAIDLFPLFFEAIDNRAFTFMELGQIRQALNDFEVSLQVNPSGVTAFFSKGECLMKLGDYAAAETIFLEGQTRFPEKKAAFLQFMNQTRALANNGQSPNR